MLYPPESAGSIMSAELPTCKPEATAGHIMKLLARADPWDTVHFIYVVDDSTKLLGEILISKVLQSPPDTLAKDLMRTSPATLLPHSDQEKAIFLSVKNDVDSIPVIDHDDRLLGVIGPKAIIDIMHAEHLEDALLSAGVRHGKNGQNLVRLATGGLWHTLKSRAPWLVFGAVAGLLLGLISSLFEASLEKSIALAYFIPVVAYIADSVGTQSEAITVRALATLKINALSYLVRELLIGLCLGSILGIMGGIGALFISHEPLIAITVTLSLLTASTVATSLAATIPILFKKLGKDPALGSGPLATALQDLLSVMVYFLFALWLI